MKILLAQVQFGGNSCVVPTPDIEQGVQKPSGKGIFCRLAERSTTRAGGQKAGCFQLAFLACWLRQEQRRGLAQKVPLKPGHLLGLRTAGRLGSAAGIPVNQICLYL